MNLREALGNFGPGQRVPTPQGDYFVSPLTILNLQELEDWVKSQVVLPVIMLHGQIPPERYDEALRIAISESSRDEYSILGSKFSEYIMSTKGLMQMLFVRLRSKHPEITQEKTVELFLDHTEAFTNALTPSPDVVAEVEQAKEELDPLAQPSPSDLIGAGSS